RPHPPGHRSHRHRARALRASRCRALRAGLCAPSDEAAGDRDQHVLAGQVSPRAGQSMVAWVDSGNLFGLRTRPPNPLFAYYNKSLDNICLGSIIPSIQSSTGNTMSNIYDPKTFELRESIGHFVKVVRAEMVEAMERELEHMD